MTPQEIFEKIQALATITSAIARREKGAVAVLNEAYKATYGHTIEFGCKNCVTKAYMKLSSLTLQNLIDMANAKYKLKKGIRIQYPAFSANFYTSENITDASAEKMLKAHPEMIKHFADYPKDQDGNLQLSVSQKQADGEKPLLKQTKAELLATHLKVIGTDADPSLTNAELVALITAALNPATGDKQEDLVDHVVTQETLDLNPDLVERGVKVGDTIKYPAKSDLNGDGDGSQDNSGAGH